MSATPFHFTVDAATKSLPLTVSANAGLPDAALDGTSVEIAGTGFKGLMVKVIAPEVPPPGVGLNTVTLAVPTAVRSDAGTVAVRCEASTKLVASATPFQFTVDAATKSLPVTARMNSGLPDAALDGARVEIDGTGFKAMIVKVSAPDVPPPGVGLNTVMLTGPTVVKSDAGTVAVRCKASTKLVASATPFQLTVDAATKLLPVTTRVNGGLPEAALDGTSVEIAGTGFKALIVKVSVLDVPPPGLGLNTVTLAVPGAVTSDAGTVAVRCEASTKLVASATPFQFTVDAATKSLPLTVSVNAGLPEAALDGTSVETAGTGFVCRRICGELPAPQALSTASVQMTVAKNLSEFKIESMDPQSSCSYIQLVSTTPAD